MQQVRFLCWSANTHLRVSLYSGYDKLESSEIDRLLDQLDVGRSGRVAKSQFAASQLDWRMAQLHHRERWLAAARQAFSTFDTNADGYIDVANITQTLRTKLPPHEVIF